MTHRRQRKGKSCSRTKYKAAFKRLIKTHPFKTAVRMAWKVACR